MGRDQTEANRLISIVEDFIPFPLRRVYVTRSEGEPHGDNRVVKFCERFFGDGTCSECVATCGSTGLKLQRDGEVAVVAGAAEEEVETCLHDEVPFREFVS